MEKKFKSKYIGKELITNLGDKYKITRKFKQIIMKTVTINITHDEVFEDLTNQFKEDIPGKGIEMITEDNDNIIINVTGTLAELESE